MPEGAPPLGRRRNGTWTMVDGLIKVGTAFAKKAVILQAGVALAPTAVVLRAPLCVCVSAKKKCLCNIDA